jgi:hypothetical protein
LWICVGEEIKVSAICVRNPKLSTLYLLLKNKKEVCLMLYLSTPLMMVRIFIEKYFIEAVHRSLDLKRRLCFLLTTDGDIKMRATNLETGIDLKIEGRCVADGVVSIPATILQQIAGSLTGSGALTIEHVGDTILLTSGTSKSSIKTVPYDDFPSIPFLKTQNNITTRVLSLFSSIVVVPHQLYVELCGIYLGVEGGVLTVVATDHSTW